MSEAVQQLQEALADQPANPLRNHQVEEYKSEASRLRAVVDAPPYVTGVDRGGAAKQYRKVQTLLDEQAAKPLTGEKKDRVYRLTKELESEISLLPREVMRRNPAGAVGEFLRHENSSENQQKIQQWKRAQLALEPTSNDPDLANIERLRPEKIHDTGGTSTFMADAQIPGKFAMTPQAKANWPLGEPKAETALQQVQKREMSEKQKAALAKAREARLAKKEPS